MIIKSRYCWTICTLQLRSFESPNFSFQSLKITEITKKIQKWGFQLKSMTGNSESKRSHQPKDKTVRFPFLQCFPTKPPSTDFCRTRISIYKKCSYHNLHLPEIFPAKPQFDTNAKPVWNPRKQHLESIHRSTIWDLFGHFSIIVGHFICYLVSFPFENNYADYT